MGRHDPVAWAIEKLLEALKQLKATHKQLGDAGITKLDHELHAAAILSLCYSVPGTSFGK